MSKYLIEKEFKQIRRNSCLSPADPVHAVPDNAGTAVGGQVRRYATSTWPSSTTTARPTPGDLTEKASASAYFNLVDVASSYEEAMKGVESGQTDIILEIPAKIRTQADYRRCRAGAHCGQCGQRNEGAGQFVPHGHRERLLGRLAQRKPPRSLGFRPRRPFGSPRSTSSTRI